MTSARMIWDDYLGYARPAADRFEQDAAVGGLAHAVGGMTWPMHQALDAYALATGAVEPVEVGGHCFTQDDENPVWEGAARAQQYGYWLV